MAIGTVDGQLAVGKYSGKKLVAVKLLLVVSQKIVQRHVKLVVVVFHVSVGYLAIQHRFVTESVVDAYVAEIE